MDSQNGEDSEDPDSACAYFTNTPRTPELIIVSDESNSESVCSVPVEPYSPEEIQESCDNNFQQSDSAEEPKCDGSPRPVSLEQKKKSRVKTLSALSRIVESYLKTKNIRQGSAGDKGLPLSHKMTNSDTDTGTEATSKHGIPCNIATKSATNGALGGVEFGIAIPQTSKATTSGGNIYSPEVVSVSPMSSSHSNLLEHPLISPCKECNSEEPDTVSVSPVSSSQPGFLEHSLISPGKEPNSEGRDNCSFVPFYTSDGKMEVSPFSGNLDQSQLPEFIGVPNLNTEVNFQKTLEHITFLKSLNKQANEASSTTSVSLARPSSYTMDSQNMLPPSEHRDENSESPGCQNYTVVTPGLDSGCNEPETLSSPKSTLLSETDRSIIKEVQSSESVKRCTVPGTARLPSQSSSSDVNGKKQPLVVTIDSDSDVDEPQRCTSDAQDSNDLDATSDALGTNGLDATSDALGTNGLDATSDALGTNYLDVTSDALDTNDIDVTSDALDLNDLHVTSSDALESNSASANNPGMPDEITAQSLQNRILEIKFLDSQFFMACNQPNISALVDLYSKLKESSANSKSNLSSMESINQGMPVNQNVPHEARNVDFDSNRHLAQNVFMASGLNQPISEAQRKVSLNRTPNAPASNSSAPLDRAISDTSTKPHSTTDTSIENGRHFLQNNLLANNSTLTGSVIQQNSSLNDTSGMSPLNSNSVASLDSEISGSVNLPHASSNMAFERSRHYNQNNFIASNSSYLYALLQRNANANRPSAGPASILKPMSSFERMMSGVPNMLHSSRGTTFENSTHSPQNNLFVNNSAQIVSAAQRNSIRNNLSDAPSTFNSVTSLDPTIPAIPILSHPPTDISFVNNRNFPQNELVARGLVQEGRELNNYRDAAPKGYTNANLSKTAALGSSFPGAVMPTHSANSTNIATCGYLPQNNPNQLQSRFVAERFKTPYSDMSKTASAVGQLPFVPNTSLPPRYMLPANHRMAPLNVELSALEQEMYQQQNMHPEDTASHNVRGSAFYLPPMSAVLSPPAGNTNFVNREMYLQQASNRYGDNNQTNRFHGATGAAGSTFERNDRMVPQPAAEACPVNNGSLVNQRKQQGNDFLTFEANKEIGRLTYPDTSTATNSSYTNSRGAKRGGRQRKSPEEKAITSTQKKSVRGRRGRGRISSNVGENNTHRIYTSDEGNSQGGYAGTHQMSLGYMYGGNERQVCPNNYNPVSNYQANNPSINGPVNFIGSRLNVPNNSSTFLNQINRQMRHPNTSNAGMNIVNKSNYPNNHYNPQLMASIYNDSHSAFPSSRQIPPGCLLPNNQMNNQINVPQKASLQGASNSQNVIPKNIQGLNVRRLSPRYVSNENAAHTLPSYQEAFGMSQKANHLESFNNDFVENQTIAHSQGKTVRQETMKPNKEISSQAQISEFSEKQFPEKRNRNASNSNLPELPEDLSTRGQDNSLTRISQQNAFKNKGGEANFIPNAHNSTASTTGVLTSQNFVKDLNVRGESRTRATMLDSSMLSEAISLENETQRTHYRSNVPTKEYSASDRQFNTDVSTTQNQSISDEKPIIKNESPNESESPNETDKISLKTNESNSTANKSLILGPLHPKKKIKLAKGEDNNACHSTLHAKKAYEEERFPDFFQIVRDSNFPIRDHEELRNMWNKAQLLHYHDTTGLPVTAHARYKILEENPFPSSIQGTCDMSDRLKFLYK